MKPIQILPSIYYIGVNDRTTTRFEALWPLPNGVSYNAYIVKGDKIALIDTVEAEYGSQYLDNIAAIVGDKDIDYLIINHMEPDHSGSIRTLMDRYPGIKIVGNKQTVGMVKGFYNINDDNCYQVVAESDTIDLGGKTLRFVITPMVHWPETMMTLVEEDSLLFTGDALGTFGALNGEPLDDDLDIQMYIDEMYRYYSNIVGKYGTFVQRALAKVAPLGVKYACPTHGPVWHHNLGKVLDIYDRLSRYEGEYGVTIVYGSMYGNTARAVDQLVSTLDSLGVSNIHVHNATYAEMSDMISDAFRYKGLVVVSPTYSMHIFPPVAAFLEAMETREIKNKVLGLMGSYTWTPAASKLLNEWAEKMNLPVTATVQIRMAPDDLTAVEIRHLAEEMANALNK